MVISLLRSHSGRFKRDVQCIMVITVQCCRRGFLETRAALENGKKKKKVNLLELLKLAFIRVEVSQRCMRIDKKRQYRTVRMNNQEKNQMHKNTAVCLKMQRKICDKCRGNVINSTLKCFEKEKIMCNEKAESI